MEVAVPGNRRGQVAAAARTVVRAATSSTGKKLIQAGINYVKSKKRKEKAKAKAKHFASSEIISGQGGKPRALRKRKASAKKRTKAPIKKRIAALEKKFKQATSHHTYKTGGTLQLSSGIASVGWGELSLITPTKMELMISKMPRLDPTAPATPTVWDASTTKQPQTWNINAHVKVMMRNNYLFPCNLKFYVLKPRQDHSVSPLNAITNTNGIQKQATPSIDSALDPWFFPNDSQQFLDLWTIIETRDIQLQPGDECDYSYNESFVYDQEIQDDNAATWLKKYSRAALFRVQGVVCHDSSALSTVTFAQAALDIVSYLKLTVAHTTEAPIRTIYEVVGIPTAVVGTPVVGTISAEKETAL